MTQTDAPWGSLKADRIPSSHTEKAESEGRLSEGQAKGHHTHFCNWAQRIHHPLDPPDGHFPCIRWVHRLYGFISATESNERILGRRHLCLTMRRRNADLDGKLIREGQKRSRGGGSD